MPAPTIGAPVWFFDYADSPATEERSLQAIPHPAVVAFVHSDRSVNIAGFSYSGTSFGRMNVPFVQENDARPNAPFCCAPGTSLPVPKPKAR